MNKSQRKLIQDLVRGRVRPGRGISGQAYALFLRRFREKTKPSVHVYGVKDRRLNRNPQNGDVE